MKTIRLTPTQIKLKKVLKPIVESIIREGRKYKIKESTSKFNKFYITVDIDERGDYGATVYDPNDDQVWDIDTEGTSDLIDSGYLKYKPHQDLGRLGSYLISRGIIPKGSTIYKESDWEDIE